jgi:expansin (peptidoglycan-binding protein)
VQALVAAPTATPTAIPTATRTPMPFVAGSVSGKATPYADSLAGNSMGCAGAGPYNINDITVIAVSAAQHSTFPCGTKLEVCGQLGCITGYRKDSCPGCGNGDVDLSRAGFRTVCGNVNNCVVRTRSIP